MLSFEHGSEKYILLLLIILRFLNYVAHLSSPKSKPGHGFYEEEELMKETVILSLLVKFIETVHCR